MLVFVPAIIMCASAYLVSFLCCMIVHYLLWAESMSYIHVHGRLANATGSDQCHKNALLGGINFVLIKVSNIYYA